MIYGNSLRKARKEIKTKVTKNGTEERVVRRSEDANGEAEGLFRPGGKQVSSVHWSAMSAGRSEVDSMKSMVLMMEMG